VSLFLYFSISLFLVHYFSFKKKLIAEGYFKVSEKIGHFRMLAPDGQQRLTNCANTETLFQVIQSIPSPKVGKERPDEIESPELAMRRPRVRAPAGCAAHSTECRHARRTISTPLDAVTVGLSSAWFARTSPIFSSLQRTRHQRIAYVSTVSAYCGQAF
jgi:hypothetical protein